MENTEYELKTLREQVAMLETALNEVRQKQGLTAIKLPKSAYNPHR